MSTTSSLGSLPIVDLSPLSSPTVSDLTVLSESLFNVFSTTGFAYLENAPLSFTSSEVINLAQAFFELSDAQKSDVAKASYMKANKNTYRGYFPVQMAGGNRKEGFDIGATDETPRHMIGNDKSANKSIHLDEANAWPFGFAQRAMLERLHTELQDLSKKLLLLLATALGKPENHFEDYMTDSLSTLRLLHYPPPAPDELKEEENGGLCCTEHTDSGILTLLHQDETGGLEVLASSTNDGETEKWIPAPYIPNTIIVNIGDLMAHVSGGKYRATLHRVRNAPGNGCDRYSVPFFFEPGERCVITSVEATEKEEVPSLIYGDYVRRKMSQWVEFQGAAGPGA